MSPSESERTAASPVDSSASEPACPRFVLDGKVISLRCLAPTRTLLEVLREELGRTGTKEGCAEGDCGACTVVVGELDARGEVRHRAINACIQLAATLDGRELLTVESLSGGGEPLHPVQQALVECHASQCGFCTPGFAMSLFTLYKAEQRPSPRALEDALAGNLCRCTGYRPIMAAAERMFELADAAVDPGQPGWLRQAHCMHAALPAPSTALLKSLVRTRALELRSDEGSFWAPLDLAGACARYVQHPAACVLAGGTDVGLWITKQERALPEILYLGNVLELKRCEQRADQLWIGAAAALSDALPLLSSEYPGVSELCARFASPPIRNAGTLGGNIANASPVGDLPPLLLALDAQLGLRRGERERELPLSAFFLDYQRTAREPGELLTHVRVPRAEADQIVVAYKVSKRFDQDIAGISAAFSARLRAGVLTEVRIAFGGMAKIPKRASALERALEGQPLTEASMTAAQQALDQDFAPISDMRASAPYRAQVARNLVRRFFLACAGDPAAQGVYREGR